MEMEKKLLQRLLPAQYSEILEGLVGYSEKHISAILFNSMFSFILFSTSRRGHAYTRTDGHMDIHTRTFTQTDSHFDYSYFVGCLTTNCTSKIKNR